MKKRSISLLLVMMIIISMALTSCGSKENNGEASSVTANKSAKELLTTATEKLEDYSDMKDYNFNTDFSINMTEKGENLAINGNFGTKLFTGETPKMMIEFNLDKAEQLGLPKDIKVSAYADDKSVIFTLDQEKYYKLSYNVLVSFGLFTQEQLDEIINMVKDLSTAKETLEGLSKGALSESAIKQGEELRKIIINWADKYTVDGSKEINGETVTVIKGQLTLDNVKEYYAKYAEIVNSISEDMGEKATTEDVDDLFKDIPADLSPVDMEFYISDKTGDLVGGNVDFAKTLKACYEISEDAEQATFGECKIGFTIGKNNTETFEMPEADESSLEDISAAFEEFADDLNMVKFIDDGENSETTEYDEVNSTIETEE